MSVYLPDIFRFLFIIIKWLVIIYLAFLIGPLLVICAFAMFNK